MLDSFAMGKFIQGIVISWTLLCTGIQLVAFEHGEEIEFKKIFN